MKYFRSASHVISALTSDETTLNESDILAGRGAGSSRRENMRQAVQGTDCYEISSHCSYAVNS